MGRRPKKEKPLLARNIVARRRALGWTGMDLAKEAKLPYPTVRDIEAGDSGGWLITRQKIAKALGCTESELHHDPVDSQQEDAVDTIRELIKQSDAKKDRYSDIPTDILEGLSGAPQEVLRAVRLALSAAKQIAKARQAEKKK